MCGIAGFVGTKNDALLLRLLRIIEHRGRDDRAVYSDARVHMGMNRLAIVDLRRGLYPVYYKHYVLLYNGEIYNYKKLKRELAQRKIIIPTDSDAYVILPLYDLYGSDAFSMLEGMFALSIYDTKRRELILARDKSGEKPLYYLHTKDTFAFSSETRALFPLLVDPRVRLKSLPQYLSKGYVYGTKTLEAGVNKALASECLVYNLRSHNLARRSYWRPHIIDTSSKPIPDGGYARKLQSLLENSVKARMISDVPVGCFISGGVDSALIAHFASKITNHLRTYSIAFPGFVRNDESLFARYAARVLHTHHTEILCTSESVRPLIEDIGTYIDEPISDPAILPTLLLAQEARKSVKVVLTGEGADELFAGYPRYVRQLAVEYVSSHRSTFGLPLELLRAVRRNRFTQVSQTLEQRYRAQHIWSESDYRLLLGKPGIPQTQIYASRLIRPLLRMQLSDYRGYLSEQLFMKADKSTMAYNLESRAPYVDTDIINFAFNLPETYKVKWLQGKYLLKLAASAYFPRWFVWRPKHGFSVPLRDWFCQELKIFALQSIEDIRAHAPHVNVRYYQSVVSDHIERRADNTDKIWSVIVLTAWLKRHKLSL